MRWQIRELGCVLLLATTAASAGHAQAAVQLPAADRVRLTEAFRLVSVLRHVIWPGWERTALPLLLVTDSAEFLIGHPRPTADFNRIGYDTLLSREVWTRPTRFSPTLLATFPAVGGAPTIVIGSAEATGKSSVAWVLTILHEHFHQWQYSQPDYYAAVARLDLAQGDTTGRWMLDYGFPYDSAPVQQAMHRLASALGRALEAPRENRASALGNVIAAREALRGSISANDYRYFEFQLWQEGVARFIEYAIATAATGLEQPAAQFRSLADYESYSGAALRARRALRRELEQVGLARRRRVAFYPVGAAMALLLEGTRSDWKRIYEERPFALAALLPDSL